MKLLRNSRSLVFSTLLALLPGTAFAECFPASSAPADASCVVMPRGEQRGVWFDLNTADELRRLKLEAPELRLQLDLYSKYSSALKLSTEEYKAAYAAQVEATRQIQAATVRLNSDLDAARAVTKAAEDAKNSWWRSPGLWFGGGVIVTVVAGIVGASLAN